MASIARHSNGQWRARWKDPAGKERAKHFDRKVDAQRFLDEITAAQVAGTYLDPRKSKITMNEWADHWLIGYGSRRKGSVSSARTHLKLIKDEFGPMPLKAILPSHIRNWTARLARDGKDGQPYADSTIRAVYLRLSQVLSDAVEDGALDRNRCSRRTSPRMGKPIPYVASTEQVWALYDAMEPELRGAVLLGAFAGLRIGEVAGLRVSDVDFLRAVISPAVQWPNEPLKTEASMWPVPVPRALVEELAASVAMGDGSSIIRNAHGQRASADVIDRRFREARAKVPDLPKGFRFHDLRHYFASLLIDAGLDPKKVQQRLRHESVITTMATYGHLWPDKDEVATAAVAAAMVRPEPATDKSRTTGR